uniref:Picornavirus capsid domain-containing protein n=1 Tax=Picornavirales sp. TaxID=1955153 RepID=A0A514D7P4_9VIRU|nr:MAG: hypothetical protein H1RhizoLitter1238_000002 [Picornavirales sp.]
MKTTLVSQEQAITGTTNFMNSEDQKVATRDLYHDVARGLNKATTVGYTQDIKDFLMKPVVMGYNAVTTQSAGTALYNDIIYGNILGNAVMTNKVSGFLGLRATAVIRMQVNANRFQAGRLIMVYIPQGNIANTYPGMRLRNLRSITQLPRVELDLATESEVTMEIPYISPAPYYNLITGEGELGRLCIYVYSPLATGAGSTVFDVTYWGSLKDIELVTPAVAQMAERIRSKKTKKGSYQEQEAKAMGVPPISSALSGLARVSETLSSIPVLTPLATPATWVLNCMAGIASVFGYSKPLHEGKTDKVQIVTQPNMQNEDGIDVSANMGLSATNKLTILPGFAGTTVDEMALTHLVQLPAYWKTVSWTTSNNLGDVLLTFDVDPMQFATSNVVNLWSTVDAIPLTYFQGFFEFWKGSIVLIIKIVKTPYHSGRFSICYNPGGSGATSSALSDYVLRDVVDIADQNEFRFVIPYASTRQYSRAARLTGLGSATEKTGCVTIRVINALVAPDTVDTGVQMIMEVCGGPDYEMMCPRRTDWAPIIVSGWAAQMNDVAPNKNKNVNEAELLALGSASIDTSTMDPAQYCVGEKVNSVLQLIKRYSPLKSLVFNSQNAAIDIRPFVIGACYSADVVSFAAYPTGDVLSCISPCFGYARGSVRMIVFAKGCDASGAMITAYAYPSTETTPLITSDLSLRAGQAISLQNQSGMNVIASANVPPYQQLHSRLSRMSSTGAVEPIDPWTSSMRLGFTTYDSSATPVNRQSVVYRAAGDDFTLGFFLGVPLATSFF